MELSRQELRHIEKALRMLRDRHYRNYYNAKDEYSESAQNQLAIYHEIEDLRTRVRYES